MTRMGAKVKARRSSKDSQIRILRLITRLNVGGPSWQVSVLSRGLDQSHFETLLVAGSIEAGEIDYSEILGRDPVDVRIRSLSRSVRVVGEVVSLVRLWLIMRRFRPHVIHTHMSKAGVLGRVAAILARVPVRVHTFHGHVLHGYFGPKKTAVVVLIERILARYSSALVSVGTQVRDELLEAGIGKPEQFVVVPPGVTRTKTVDGELARRRVGVEAHEKVILFVGRLTAIKRLDRLVEAFRIVVNEEPSSLLVIVGDGELRESVQLEASDVGDRVRFVGWQSDLADFYASADVVALTSDNEGMPVSLIEAAMAGRPCVTTDVGSAPEVVESGVTGFVVSRTPEAVATGILDLIRHPGRCASMGDRARRRALTLFGEDRLVSDHRLLYERLLVEAKLKSR